MARSYRAVSLPPRKESTVNIICFLSRARAMKSVLIIPRKIIFCLAVTLSRFCN